MKEMEISPFTRFMAATAFTVICFATPASGSLISNLEAYYSFDSQNGDDASEKALNVTLFGGVVFEPGLFGYALAPNGDNAQYAARTTNDPTLNFGVGDFTIQAWVKYTDTSGEQILLEKFSGATGPGWTFTKLSNNRFGFAHDVGSNLAVQSNVQTIELYTWHHMLIRRTSGTYEMFFDNDSIASAFSTTGSTSTAPLLIGRRNETDGRDFALNGLIDEIAIWSRSLSNDEIAILYNGGQGRAIPVTEVAISEIHASEGKAVLKWQGNRSNLVYMVEFCVSLPAAEWSPAMPTSQWWVSGTMWTNTGPAQPQEFFRIKAKEQ